MYALCESGVSSSIPWIARMIEARFFIEVIGLANIIAIIGLVKIKPYKAKTVILLSINN